MSELLVGYHPVREALRHRPHTIKVVLVSASRRGARRREIEALCQRHRVHLEVAPAGRFDTLGVEVHNGFAAEAEPLPRADRVDPADRDLVVLLEDLRDPRNFGAVLRVCEGAGVGRVLVRDRGSAPLSAVAVRAAAGAAEWIEVERITNTARTIDELKEDGFWVYGAAMEGVPPWDLELTGKVAFCLGGEESGLRRRTRSKCDHLVGLPMRGRVESLNVSTAAAAMLYEAVRQRTGG